MMSMASANYLHVAAISVAGYEYFVTLPAEYRFYKAQSRLTRPSLACLLFFLIRYCSVTVLIIRHMGQFGSFSESTCKHYYFLAAPIMKVVQTVVCQIILFVRTYAISKRSRTVAITVGTALILFSLGEAVTSLYARIPSYNADGNRHCTSGNSPGHTVAWIHYLLSMCYDLLTLLISSYYLLGRQPCLYLSFSSMARVLLVDGLGYFVMLTAVNIVNLVFFKTAPTTALQTAASSLGYTVTMIGGQRILIHLRDLADKSQNRTPKRPATVGNSGGDGSDAPAMPIHITIQRDVEAYGDVPDGSGSLQLGRTGKNPNSFVDI